MDFRLFVLNVARQNQEILSSTTLVTFLFQIYRSTLLQLIELAPLHFTLSVMLWLGSTFEHSDTAYLSILHFNLYLGKLKPTMLLRRFPLFWLRNAVDFHWLCLSGVHT